MLAQYLQLLQPVPLREPLRPVPDRPYPTQPFPVAREHAILLQPTVCRRTRPRVILSTAHDPGPHRIALNVADGRPQVGLVQRRGEEPALPQMPLPSLRAIDALRVLRMQGSEYFL
jgi:hypothetical protein